MRSGLLTNLLPIYTDMCSMKIALWLTFFSSTPLLAQEFLPPSDKDLMAVSFNFLEESKKVMSKVPEEDCDKKREKEKKVVEKPQGQEIFCLCELKDGQIKDPSLLESLIGEYDSELTINTGNDNFLHGGLQKMGDKARSLDGDDRGRTFNGGLNYSLIGTEGELSLKLDSTGFGKFSKVDGYRKTPDGKYYLNFREVNTLDLRLDKNLKKSETEKSYWIGEFKFTNETDDGNLSRGVQEWWHTFNKKQMGMNVIQYKYLNEEPDKNTVTIMGGLGKEWIKNIGNWKCQTRLEAKAGASVDFSGNMSMELAAKAENKLSHSSVPWLALSTWVQAGTGFMGPSAEGGIMLSAEKKFRKVTIKPFIGIERHRTSMDKKFGEVSGNPYENYHVLGVTIKY